MLGHVQQEHVQAEIAISGGACPSPPKRGSHVISTNWQLMACVSAAPTCSDSQSVVTFNGTSGAFVGALESFIFPNWTYNSKLMSSTGNYPQAILNQGSSLQTVKVFSVTLCMIAACGTNAASIAVFTGSASGGAPTPTTGSFPAFQGAANVTFDSTWTGVTQINITTTGSPGTYTLELWALYFVGSG